jgi:large subunit ribosomal protein L29
MKNSEIRDLSLEELTEKHEAMIKTVADLRMAHAITPLENPLQIRNARRTAARLATELTKRQNQ